MDQQISFVNLVNETFITTDDQPVLAEENIEYIQAEEISGTDVVVPEGYTELYIDNKRYIIPDNVIRNEQGEQFLMECSGEVTLENNEPFESIEENVVEQVVEEEPCYVLEIPNPEDEIPNPEDENPQTTTAVEDEMPEFQTKYIPTIDHDVESKYTPTDNHPVESKYVPNAEDNDSDVSRITGKNLLTGQKIYLSGFFEKMMEKHRGNVPEYRNVKGASSEDEQSEDGFLNIQPVSKLVVGKMPSGKKVVGKILKITKKVDGGRRIQNPKQKDRVSNEAFETGGISNSVEDEPRTENDESNTIQELIVDGDGKVLQIVDRNVSESVPQVTDKCDDPFIYKTLVGLMNLESVQRQIANRFLNIKYVEKRTASHITLPGKTVKMYQGRLIKSKPKDEEWTFVSVLKDTDSNSKLSEVPLAVNLIVTIDEYQRKTTKVLIPELGGNITCRHCHKAFRSEAYYRRHLAQHDEYPDNYCHICNKVFIDQDSLEIHCSTHIDHTLHTCELCGRTYGSKGALKRHLVSHAAVSLKCRVCSQKFMTIEKLRKHEIVHTANRHDCDLCSKSFADAAGLNFHRRFHDTEKRYHCETCGREFTRHSNLLRHMEIHRGTVSKFRCYECGCSYNFASSLTRHIVTNHMSKASS